MNGLALCSGYGGLELALERFFPGFRTVCHVESEAFAVSHLIKKMEEGRLYPAPVWDDLRSFDGEPWCGKVDIIAGGFPCQPFSNAGKQLGDKDDRHLWPFIVQIVRKVRPRFLFFENVPGVVKWILDDILLDLTSMGYNASWCVVRAGDIGAPHQRARWFLWAEACDSDCYGLEENAFKKRSKRIDKEWRKNMEGFRREFACNSDFFTEESADPKRIGWNEDKQSTPRRKLDVEGLGDKISNTHNRRKSISTSRKVPGITMLSGFSKEGSIDKWGGGFYSNWKIEPSMGRLVDGSSDWVDKLRILGNGVVPQQAHYALSILTSTMNKWREEE